MFRLCANCCWVQLGREMMIECSEYTLTAVSVVKTGEDCRRVGICVNCH